MILSTLNHFLNLLSGGDPSPADRKDIFNETALLVLARATDSDTNIKPIEVDTVRDIVKKVTGEEVSSSDVRVAAHSKIYEEAPLEKHLSRIADKIDIHDRTKITQALAEVILVDGRVTTKEVRFFDMVVFSLGLTPASLSGLFAED